MNDEQETNHAFARSLSNDRLEADDLAKQKFVAGQWRELLSEIPHVTCWCGLKMPLRFAYRCLYCGEYYCQSCAESHFGITRAKYQENKAANVELRGAALLRRPA